MAKRRRVVRRATSTPVPPHTGGPNTQSTYNLIQQAFTDADQWWANQGSPPATLQLAYGQTTPDDRGRHAAAQAQYRTGDVTVDPEYVSTLTNLLANPSRKSRLAALNNLWGMAAHERGHNIGYTHDTPGSPLMADGIPGIPGRGYEWAAQMLPSKKVLRKRRGGR